MQNTDLVARLRASREQAMAEQTDDGRKDGAEWATKGASFLELRQLEAECRDITAWDFNTFAQHVLGHEKHNVSLLRDDWRGPLVDFVDEWVRSGYREYILVNDTYVRGFCAGALEVWLSVKDAVNQKESNHVSN